ncbi:LysR family transcriptional regulator [Amycolatopsis magusensis]|uniref:DNA-binding transcriptional LysR family regulator n=1 Tax=Amycolatopsis magusensis TaxID=882444 RepID=A0ABS4Q3R9_9PSEU|nr:LysR family transcriptional regulator [Amycolatopsis magusensis]MBP2186327.1 DNA-binding transcriptional LysR family regulator [Amycolatopsis magusensis]
MELRQVEYFLAVVDHGGITPAAAATGVAQPSVSQGIRSLERALGVDLFHRIGRGLVLTSAGHEFIGPARQLLRDVVAAEGFLRTAPRGRLDIHAWPFTTGHPVAALVGAFRQRHPGVSVRIGELRDNDSVPSLLRDGHCELVFCYLPAGGDGLTTHELGVHEYALVFPPGTEVPPDDPLPLAALPDLPLIVVPKGSPVRAQIEDALAGANRRTRASAVLRHRAAAERFVLAGVGVGVVERSRAEDAAREGAVIRGISPPIRRRYGIVYDAQRLSAVGKAFLESAFG